MMHALRMETMNRSEHFHMNSGRNMNEIKDFGFMLRREFMRRFMGSGNLQRLDAHWGHEPRNTGGTDFLYLLYPRYQ